MKSLVLGIILVYSNAVCANTFKNEGKIKVSNEIHYELSADPGLQTKKLNSILIKPIGKAKIEIISFDATMPEHDHGMVVKASKPVKTKDGNFEVKGVKLHMPGEWQFEIVAKIDGKDVTTKYVYQLQP